MNGAARLATAPLAALLLCMAAEAALGVSREEADKAGAYCPLPEPGEKPACLGPAQAHYEDFFEAVEEGRIDPAQAARVEADLAASQASDQAYLALSSLSYGYWRLAMRAAETEEVDPEVLARLESWNQLLATAYEQSGSDPRFRGAVREAATDLHAHAPAEGLQCRADDGSPVRCQPTLGLLETIDSLDTQLGMRGAIRRVLERLFGSDGK